MSQKPVLDIGGVPHELGDPGAVRGGADTGDLNAARGQLNQDEDREPGQTARRPDLDGEEVGGGEHLPVGRQKLPPGPALLAFWRGFQPVRPEHVGNRASRHLMPEVVESTPDASVASVAILSGHPDDEVTDLVHDPWTTRYATAAAIVFPADQLSMPAQECVRRDEGLQLTKRLATERLGLRGQATALGIGEPETARAELFPEDAILFLEIVDGVTRLLIDPTGDGYDEEPEYMRKRRHTRRG